MKDLLKYKITIDDAFYEGEELGMSMIAYTAQPAILTKGFAFQASTPKNFYFQDDLKYRIVAPVMIPMDIYRCDSNEEYYVQFTCEEIEKIFSKFMKDLSNRNIFNIEHDTNNVVPAYVLEAWIVDNPENDKAFTTYGINVPKGTLMMTSQITDPDTYKELVESGKTGYSIEGFLGLSIPDIKETKLSVEPPFHDNCKCSIVDGELVTDAEVCEYCLEQENNLKLNKQMDKKFPAGEYIAPDGTIFIVAEDGTFTTKTVKEKMAEEAVVEETKKEEMAEEVIVEEAPVEEAPVVATYTKEEIDAKFEEIYKLIADIKAEEAMDEEVEIEEVQMSAHQRFAEFVRFSNSL